MTYMLLKSGHDETLVSFDADEATHARMLKTLRAAGYEITFLNKAAFVSKRAEIERSDIGLPSTPTNDSTP